MGKFIFLGSLTIIFLILLQIDASISSQGKSNFSENQILNVSDDDLGIAIGQYPAFVLDCY